jgi:peptidyl-prolyl cis-trans isomerase D
MMRQMRQNTKIIMLVTALAFVALMVFEWGMDMSGQSSGGDLGRVGRTNVSVLEWQEAQRQLYEQIQASQNEPITSAQSREIDDMAWDQVVNQILIRNELERRGIRVSDQEIRQAARFSPPPQLQGDPSFQTDGNFDPAKYQAFLQQASADPLFMQQLEAYYRDVIPRSKLVRQVSSGIFVSDAELWRDYRDRNETTRARFLVLEAPSWIGDSDVSVSDAEIEAYYRENRESFEVEASAQVRYTWVSMGATAADSTAAYERALEVREEIQAGADFAELASIESDDLGTAREGGELGTFGRGQMVGPFEDAVFSIPVGEVSEPVQTDFGWHLIEVTERDDAAEEVTARHILFSYEPSGEREFELLSRADSLEALGEAMSVADAAAELGLEVLEGEITTGFAVLPSVGNAGEAQDWIFEDEEGVGAVSPVFENAGGFYMVEILSEEPARTLELAEVRADIENLLRSRRKTELALERAAGLAERVRSGAASLEALAESEGGRLEAPEPFSRAGSVPGVGSANAAIGVAFGTPVGEVGGPVAVGSRVVLVEVLEREEADRTEFEAVKEVLRAQVTQQLRQQRLELWLEGLRETTRIVDRRAEYFRAAEEMADRPQIPMAF